MTDFQTYEDEDGYTRLDRAWLDAEAVIETDEHEEASATFMDLLLSETLFCPVLNDLDDPGAFSTEDGIEAIEPVIMATENGAALPLFDTEDRLSRFVDEPTPFVALPGRVFFQMVAAKGAEGSVQIALNPGVSEAAPLFPPSAVLAIADAALASGEAEEVESGEEMLVLPPDVPVDLVTALAGRLAAEQSKVFEAWLFTLVTKERTLPVLGLLPGETATPSALEDLAHDLSQLGAGFLDGEPLDITILPDDGPLIELARRQGFAVFGAGETAPN